MVFVASVCVAMDVEGSTLSLRVTSMIKEGCRCGSVAMEIVAMEVSRTYTQVKGGNVGELRI
jgi:hypothetical protein